MLDGPVKHDLSHHARPSLGRPSKASTSWVYTAFGVLFLAIMLFPVYWMVNGSLQPTATPLQGSGARPIPTSTDTGARCSQQGANLLTSLVVAVGSVIVSLDHRDPGGLRPRARSARGVDIVLFGILISQMVPGIVVANALYSAYNNLGLLNSIPGLILADSTAGIPFAILVLRAFMGNIPSS